MQQDGGQDGGTHPRNTQHMRVRNGAAVWKDGAVKSSGFAYVKNKAQKTDRLGGGCACNTDSVSINPQMPVDTVSVLAKHYMLRL